VLFAKPAVERETLNDCDETIMRFWRALREQPEALAASVALTPYGRTEWQLSRELEVDDDVEAARRLLVNVDQSFSRSRQSWSPPSLLRDRRGRWQPGSWANLPPKIRAAAHRLTNVCLECGDALDLIPRWDLPRTVIYCDPPYVGEHRLTMSKGYAHDAGPDLWTSLVKVLLAVEHAAVILSGYPCEETERLSSSAWREVSLIANRNVQARAGGTLPKTRETVWLNPRVPLPSQITIDEALAEDAA
jgi:DNA adenine methylase